MIHTCTCLLCAKLMLEQSIIERDFFLMKYSLTTVCNLHVLCYWLCSCSSSPTDKSDTYWQETETEIVTINQFTSLSLGHVVVVHFSCVLSNVFTPCVHDHGWMYDNSGVSLCIRARRSEFSSTAWVKYR